MKILLSFILCLFVLVSNAANPSSKSFRGIGGILVTSNDVTAVITIDGTGIGGTNTGQTATQVTNIVNNYVTTYVTVTSNYFNTFVTNLVTVTSNYLYNFTTNQITYTSNYFNNANSTLTATIYQVGANDTNYAATASSNNVRVAAGANVTVTTNGSAGVTIYTVAGPLAGETNFNGEVSVTNSTRVGLVNGKASFTNLLRSVQGGRGIVLTNQGTNVMFAVDPSILSGGLTTNANQFLGVPLSIPANAKLTNIYNYGLFDLTIANGNRVMVSEGTPTGQIIEGNVTTTELGTLSGIGSTALTIQLSNNVRVAAGANITVTPSGAGGVMTYTVAGPLSGETNFNGEVSVTNSTRIGLVNGKASFTNLLRSVQGGNGIILTNEGTNVMFAVDPSVLSAATAAEPWSSVQFNSNGTMRGSAKFTFTNGLVGINTIPQQALDVAGTINASNEFRLGNSSSNRVAIPYIGSGWFGGYNVKGDAVPANGPVRDSEGVSAAISLGIGGLKAYTAAQGAADGSLTERMVVKTDGKVGIGSISPAHLLALNMAAANDRAFSVYTGATSSQYGAIGFQTAFDNTQNGSEIRNYNPSGGTDADVAFWVSDSATGALAERVRVKGVNGYTGIGTNAPAAQLHIQHVGSNAVFAITGVTNATPANTVTPVAWIPISLNGTNGFIPFYQ